MEAAGIRTREDSTAGGAGPVVGAPRLGALVRSEVLRARSRRSTKWLALLALIGVLVMSAIMWFTTAQATQADLDAAVVDFMAEQQRWYEECLADPNIPDTDCSVPTQADAQVNAFWLLDRKPFTQDSMGGLMTLAGALGALVVLMLGASAGGADWGARTMGLLLSWEPRRLRVFGVRLGVVVGLAILIEAVLVGTALAAAWFIADRHGMDVIVAGAEDYMRAADVGSAVETASRWVPLAGLAAAAGFGVAMATRSTGWAIGASIGFLAVLESIVQGLWSWGSQWLIQTNAMAWLQGGVAWTIRRDSFGDDRSANLVEGTDIVLGPGQIWLSQGRAIGWLLVLVLLVLGIAAMLLRTRDVD